MPNLHAKRFSRPTSIASVLLTLSACGSEPRIEYRDRQVLVPTPVVQPWPAFLIGDCDPGPAPGAVTIRDVLDRLAATETALASCRDRLAELRRLNIKP